MFIRSEQCTQLWQTYNHRLLSTLNIDVSCVTRPPICYIVLCLPVCIVQGYISARLCGIDVGSNSGKDHNDMILYLNNTILIAHEKFNHDI